MTAVRFRDSARYGLRLYAYALGITILGGVGVGLGAALAWPEVQAWRGPGIAEPAVGAGGGVLLFLGLSILATGYFGIGYKVLADGVAAGTSTTAPAGGKPAATEEAEPATADPNIGAEPEPQPEAGSGDTAGTAGAEPTGAAVGSMAGEAAGVDTTPADPPEPSPEEIAFGNSSGEAEAATEPESTYEESQPASGSDAVANQNADADPLADPSDDK